MAVATPAWFVRTKLRPPRLRSDLIMRPRLLAALDAVLDHPLTLVSAPAGSGKTTLLTTWLVHHERLAARDTCLAWLALDDDDNDPAIFLTGLIAAFAQLHPACGDTALAMLASMHSSAAEARRIVGVLLNDALDLLPADALLVLDDLHVITNPDLLAAIEYLIERVPPQLHLLIATRSDPPIGLSRLRARRQVIELRLADLRFTPAEADQLLNNALALGLDADQIAMLYGRTEGWAAGISLVISSLERMGAAERRAFLAQLQHTDRAIFDYLADEVLERQDPFVRMFLLETAVLPELTPRACEAVTGRSDAAAILDDLHRRNLFLIALDGAGSDAAYRYHDLFAAFLRERVRREHPHWLRDLHRRAAQTEAQPLRRVQHYVRAELWDAAAATIIEIGEGMIHTGSHATLRQLIESLPPDVEVQRPRLIYLHALCLHHVWELAASRPLLDRAYRDLHAAGDPLADEALAYLADTQRMLGEYDQARTTTQAALRLQLPPHQRTRMLLSHAWQALADGEWPLVITDLDEVLDLIRVSGATDALYVLAATYQSPLIILPGGVERAERFSQLAAQVAPAVGPLHAIVLKLCAEAELLRGRWDDAVTLAEQSLAVSEQLGGMAQIDLDISMVPWVCAGLRGDIQAARRGFDALFVLLQHPTAVSIRAWQSLALFQLGKIYWLAGDYAATRSIMAQMERSADPSEWPIAPIFRSMIGALVALVDGADDRAERALREAEAGQARHPIVRSGADARVLLAHIALKHDRSDDALRLVAPVLAEHAAEDTPGYLMLNGAAVIVPLLRLAIAQDIHADFAARVLALLGEATDQIDRAPTVIRVPETGETLTPREIEIVRLLAAGASNQAIADQLVISLHTVKRHVTNVLQKLGVTSRLEAVARARSLGVV